MDIDSFLDKEFKQGDSPPRPPEPAQEDETSDESMELPSDVTKLAGEIRDYLSEGKLEQVEKAYVTLWSNIAQDKLEWDRTTNKEIEAISKEIEKDFSLIEQQFSQHAQSIRHLISQAHQHLKAGQHEEGFKIYRDITEQAKQLPNAMFKQRKEIEREILRLYHEIHERIGADTMRSVAESEHQIRERIARIKPLAAAGQIDKAAKMYTDVLGLYNRVPIGFLRMKIELGKELLAIYRSIAIQKEINQLQQQLQPITKRQYQSRPHHHARPQGSFGDRKKQSAKDKAARGRYTEALHDIEIVLRMNPDDKEAVNIRDAVRRQLSTSR